MWNDVEAFQDWCGALKHHQVLGHTELAKVSRVAFSARQQLRQQAKSAIQDNTGNCILSWYASDGWSAFTGELKASIGQGTKLQRKGHLKKEFCLQKGFIKVVRKHSQHNEQDLFCPLLDFPRAMTNGKTARHFFRAKLDFFPSLRALGHKGFSISVNCFDGGLRESMQKFLEAQQALYYEDDYAQWDQTCLKEPLELSDWNFVIPCFSHVLHLAAKWALKRYAVGSVVDDCHIVTASLRNSSELLLDDVPAFVVCFIRYRDREAASDQVLITYYQLLGVHPSMLNLFVQADPYFDGDYLWVNAAIEDNPQGIALVCSLVNYCMTWRTFVDSRWDSARDTGKALLLSHSVGLHMLVKRAMDDATLQKPNLGGYAKLDLAVRMFAVVAASALDLLGDCHQVVDKDDRILMKLDEVRALRDQKLHSLQEVPCFVFDRLANFVGSGCIATTLQAQILEAAYVAVGYSEREGFSHLDMGLWALARGDIAANLATFAATEAEPEDINAWKLWQWMRKGKNCKKKQSKREMKSLT